MARKKSTDDLMAVSFRMLMADAQLAQINPSRTKSI